MIIPQPSSANCNLPGDLRVLHAARQTARQNFDSNFSLSPSSAEALAGIAHAEDVAQVLRRHVVQGERVGEETVDQGGRYRRFLPSCQENQVTLEIKHLKSYALVNRAYL